MDRAIQMTEPTKDNGNVIVAVGCAEAVAATATVTVRSRMSFSVHHLVVASRLAREVAATEKQNLGHEFGAFYEVILGASVGCIVLSTAAAEAYVNELFADRAQYFTAHDQMLLEVLWEEYEQKPLLDKFDLAYRLRTGAAIDRGAAHVQSMDRLIKLRNGIVHFKPEWTDESTHHERLSKQIEGYVGRSPWLQNELLFPRAWATTATTSWAVSAVVIFVSEFSAATGLPDRLGQFSDRFVVGT